MHRRSLLRVLPWCLALSAVAQSASDTTTFYVPFPAGGSSDVFARTLTPGLARQLQRTVVVENLAGASGSIAANKVLARGPAGDALFLGSPSETILAPATLKAVKYKPSDLRLVYLISKPSLGVYVRGDLPVNSIDELVAYARAQKDKPVTYGSVGVGSVYHLAGNAFMQAVGAPMTHVPYRGGAPLLQDLMGSQLDMALFPADGHLAKMAAGGKMRVIGMTGTARSPLFPQAGTFAESKTLPGFSTVDVWGGVFMPRVTPESLVQAVHRAAVAAMAEPDTRRAMELAAGVPLMPTMDLAQLAQFYATETQRFQEATQRAQLEPN